MKNITDTRPPTCGWHGRRFSATLLRRAACCRRRDPSSTCFRVRPGLNTIVLLKILRRVIFPADSGNSLFRGRSVPWPNQDPSMARPGEKQRAVSFFGRVFLIALLFTAGCSREATIEPAPEQLQALESLFHLKWPTNILNSRSGAWNYRGRGDSFNTVACAKLDVAP